MIQRGKELIRINTQKNSIEFSINGGSINGADYVSSLWSMFIYFCIMTFNIRKIYYQITHIRHTQMRKKEILLIGLQMDKTIIKI